MFFYLNLFGQHFFSDLFARTAVKRSPSEHQLMRYDSDSKIVSRVRVILSAKDLRRHVTRCSAGISTIIGPKWSCNSKIRQSREPLPI